MMVILKIVITFRIKIGDSVGSSLGHGHTLIDKWDPGPVNQAGSTIGTVFPAYILYIYYI